jgi:hypothetical protein
MPLPPPTSPRQPLHTRSVRVQTYAREDGLWDIDAELIDTKGYEFTMRDGSVRQVGEPVHHMHLRLTIDADYSVLGVQAAYDAAPYGEGCSSIESEYGDMVGMNLLKGFRAALINRYGRVQGCTHMTELAQILPTVAIQTMVKLKSQAVDPERRPFQLDGCHAMRSDGDVVREYLPQWYRGPTG